MKALAGAIDRARGAVQRQLDVERAYLAAWLDQLAALPARSTSDRVATARLAALRGVLATASAAVPTDVPATVRVAADRVRIASEHRAMVAADAGPRHPDLIAANAALEAAQAELAGAIATAHADLKARIAARKAGVVNSSIHRRAELAETARELRREYELLRNPAAR